MGKGERKRKRERKRKKEKEQNKNSFSRLNRNDARLDSRAMQQNYVTQFLN